MAAGAKIWNVPFLFFLAINPSQMKQFVKIDFASLAIAWFCGKVLNSNTQKSAHGGSTLGSFEQAEHVDLQRNCKTKTLLLLYTVGTQNDGHRVQQN